MEISEIMTAQRAAFKEGRTLPIATRACYLKNLLHEIDARQATILDALYQDLGKSATEGYMTEVALVRSEIKNQLKNLKKRTRPKRVRSPLYLYKARSVVYPQPYGVTLVMSPWNYPFQLTLNPVVEAISAGNTVVVKPSAYADATGKEIQALLTAVFPSDIVSVVLGGRKENAALLDQKFDYIFFTGGKEVGTLVLQKAAANLTPVTLELGGKSPCIVDATANLKIAARRIVFGKFLNCGQTCVAPDYLIVEKSVKDKLVLLLKDEIARQYGKHPLDNANYGKIVNEKHYERLSGLIVPTQVLTGGYGRNGRIEPTLLDADAASPSMQEEIFGPILPILTFENRQEALDLIAMHPTPLALYLFTKSAEMQNYFISRVPYGGGCINDTIMHLTSDGMAFGGVGDSGMGAYHGQKGFDTFTHYKSVLIKSTRIDPSVRYAPYSKKQFKIIKKLM